MSIASPMVPTPEQLLVRVASEVAFAASGLLILESVYTANDAALVMERSAASFFEVTGIALQREVVMVLARLTDRPRIGQYPTICARRLVESLPVDCTLRSKLIADVEEIEQRAQPLREWRDKYIAHNDLNESFSTKPLSAFSIKVVRDVVKRFGVLSEDLGDLLKLPTVLRPHEVLQSDGGKRLLHVLRRGLVDDDGYHERD
jgi:hypothetical protein